MPQIIEVNEVEDNDLITRMVHEVTQIAKDHGWEDENRSFGDLIALMHSELSEALEEYRSGHGFNEVYFCASDKPEGIPIELADCIIRIMHFCGVHGVNLMDALATKIRYNRSRPYRHGGKVI